MLSFCSYKKKVYKNSRKSMPLKYLLTFSFNNIIIIIILQNASEFHDIGVDTKIRANLNFFFFFYEEKNSNYP